MSKELTYSCRIFKRKDEQAVKDLVKTVFGDAIDNAVWDWKYKFNPDFDPGLLIVADKAGVIIGCDHWLLKNLKLSPSIETKAVLGADIAVHPEYRRHGIGKALIHSLRTSEKVKIAKPSLVYMFAKPSLAKQFHVPAGGYIPAPTKNVYYFKILNWKKLEKNVRVFNQQVAEGKFKADLSKLDFSLVLNFSDQPPVCLKVSNKGIDITESEQDFKMADIKVISDLTTMQNIGTKEKRKWRIFKALFTRKLKVKGSFKKLIMLYKNMWIFQEIYSQMIK